MTSLTNSFQSLNYQGAKMDNKRDLKLETVLKLVEASPFKALLKLPPEEVLDWFRSRVGQALVQGLQELRRRELAGLMSSAFSHEDTVDKLFEVRGIDSVCQMIIDLPEKVKQ